MTVDVYTVTHTTIHFSTSSGSDLIRRDATRVAIDPKIAMESADFRLYAPSLINFTDAGGIRKAQDPIIIGNATSGDIPNRYTRTCLLYTSRCV